ncbi:guanine nucleotide binding protein, alpha subunit [Entophlyctis helioformis]|nr:guanine nucleotide binding protein, alpha subunit [Entophlyctis helioformis]
MTPEDKQLVALEKQRSRAIDAMIQKEREQLKNNKDPKILILGSGDSGKSTFIKQLKILHGGGYSDDERKSFRGLILENIRESIVSVILAAREIGINIGNEESQAKISEILDYYRVGSEELARYKITPRIASMIDEIWKDQDLQKVYIERGKLKPTLMIPDNAQYFLDRVVKFGDIKFLPTNEDIVHTRSMTTQITETIFEIERVAYHFFDVGGQQKYRKQWTPFFDTVDSILFIASLASYDQALMEDPSINRMTDAIQLFAQIAHHPLLKHIPVTLFLNKKDLFEKKVPASDVVKFFPEFKGAIGNIKHAAKFFQKKFESECTDQNKQLFVHFTCCTDTEAMEIIVLTVIQAMLKKEFQSIGML